MSWFLETLLANAAVATPLAVVAWLVGRSIRRPAVQHALWVLVLVKLITPPLVSVRVTVPASWTGYFGVHEPQTVPTPPQEPSSVESVACSTVQSILTDASRLDVGHRTAVKNESFGTPNRIASVVAVMPQTIRSGIEEASTDAVLLGRSTITVEGAAARQQKSPFVSLFLGIATGIWCIGSLAWWGFNAAIVARFGRHIRSAGLRDRPLERRASELAARLGMARVPSVQVLDSSVSPMLWGCGKWTKIVLPAGLLERLDAESRDALLLHELGHFRRRDHWVRVLELIVTGLYWWHPVVWWAKRRIAVHEEECCDALVVSQSSTPRRYAEVLLETLDFLAECRPCLLPAASAMSDVPVVERRLRLIMDGGTRGTLSKCGACGLTCLVLVLPYQPLLMAALADNAEALAIAPAPTNVLDASNASVPVDYKLDAATILSRPADSAAPIGDLRLPPPTVHPLLETGPSDGPWAAATSMTGRFQLTALSGGRIQLSDGSNGSTTDLTRDGITAAVFLNRDHLLVGTKAGDVRIYDAASGAAVSFLGRHREEVTSVSLASSGRHAVTASRDGSIFVWDLEANGAILHQWNMQQPISMVRASPDGRVLAVACGDWMSGSGRALLLGLSSGQPQREFPEGSAIGALGFRAGGETLLTADWNGRVTFWDVGTGKPLGYGQIGKDAISAACFSPDTDVLAGVAMISFVEANDSDNSQESLLER